jgi:molybdopterin synthase catalytic subunit
MMQTEIGIEVTQDPLDPQAESAALIGADPSIGAIVTFVGLMRDINEGDTVTGMTLEHYPGMTEKALRAIADEAAGRWALQAVRVVHRVGALQPTQPIVFVAVASAHRRDAFQACEFLMDYLKTRAPFWKRETLSDGRERWVDAREGDSEAAERWSG